MHLIKKGGVRMKQSKKRSIFANIIISICIAIGAVVTIMTLWEYHRLGVPMPSDVVTAIMFLWGGELMIVALRQIFGSDVTKRGDK